VEVTDPRNPRVAGHFPAASSAWREVRTYGPYAYVSTEARIGMDIVDLRSMRRVNTWNRTFASAHSLWIDEPRGLAFLNGTRDTTGRSTGMRILDVARSPEDPREVGAWTNFYVHDGYTRGTLYFAAAINDGFLSIMEMADPAAPRELTRFATGGRFTHNAWLTDDGRHVFTTDEVPNRPLEGWDISNPMAPRKVSEYIGAPNTIPHNVMVDGHRLLVAHYTEGVHLLDIANPASPRLIGSYDTFEPVASGFHGAWGAYIFPGSNLILVSDIEGGLFVIEYTP
jgi:choice-of-anchor B domain-containing protein